MSTDPAQPAHGDAQGAPAAASDPWDAQPAGAAPSEQELRAAYEAELSRLTSADVVLQAVVSLLNIGGYRLGLMPPPDGSGGAQESGPAQASATRDLEQVRDAIDGVRGLLGILERRRPTDDLRQLRDALSQLQLAYAREAGAGAAQAQAQPAAGKERTPAGADTPEARRAPTGGEERPSGGEERPSSREERPSRKSPGEDQDERSSRKPPGPAEASGRLWVPGR